MSTRAALVIGLCLVVSACIITFGPRLSTSPPVYPELSFESGQITALSGPTGSDEKVSFTGPFRVTVTEHFLIVRKRSEQGSEDVHYIPRERVAWAVGFGPSR